MIKSLSIKKDRPRAVKSVIGICVTVNGETEIILFTNTLRTHYEPTILKSCLVFKKLKIILLKGTHTKVHFFSPLSW